jgi:5-methylcytosine-specific restriction endonuclease McrA
MVNAGGTAVSDSLVLNATYEPLCVVSDRRAVVLVLSAKAVVVERDHRLMRAARLELAIPVVVRLSRFVHVPYRTTIPLTRRGVLARDGHRCMYCGAAATSLDHVVPRSRGGEHVWDNVVAACARCNRLKADRSVSELGWRLRAAPRAPTGATWRVLGARRLDPRWSPYLDGARQLDAVSA